MKVLAEDSSTPDPTWPEGLVPTSYAEATAVSAVAGSETTYNVDIKRDWCIGLVPHGGYVMSVLAEGVRQYFHDRQSSREQEDLITFHVEFLSRTALGAGAVHIQPLKIGRQFSTVRAQLQQTDPATGTTTTCAEALITQGNIAREVRSAGIYLPTRPLLDRAAIPKREDCELWVTEPRLQKRRPAAFKLEHWVPKGSDSNLASPAHGPGVREEWVRWTPGVGLGAGGAPTSTSASASGGFSIASLAYIADAFRPLPEAFGETGLWFPTLSFSMEVKRAPPPGGWPWLFVRVDLGECIAGRYDQDVVIADEAGDVVAVSRHTALLISAERNLKGRMTKM